MEDITREKADQIIDAIEGIDGVEVSEFDMIEYVRGDPTTDDATPTGAEIETTAFLNLDTDADDDMNDYRLK